MALLTVPAGVAAMQSEGGRKDTKGVRRIGQHGARTMCERSATLATAFGIIGRYRFRPLARLGALIGAGAI